MKKFAGKWVIAILLTLVAVFGLSMTAYATVGHQEWGPIGDNYYVDTVVSEQWVDGVLVQSVERKWIPKNRFNPNDPRNPYPSNGTPKPSPNTNGNNAQTLRNAAINSRNDLQTYGWSYRWSTTPVETYSANDRIETNITFQVDESASADRWKCTFKQVATWENNNPVVRYYMDGQEYSADSIKRMFASYGKAR